MLSRSLAAVALVAAGLASAQPPAPQARPFHLGFTRWPADLTPEGVTMAQDFAHGDLVSVMFIGGIPWPEAQGGKAFSRDVQANLAYRPPAGKKLFLSISPLDKDRKKLAPYWGEKDNMPLPADWATRALDSTEVKAAFLNFTLRAVEAMRPDYLAIGIESNVLLSHDPAAWAKLKNSHRATYAVVKAKHPTLPVFFTTEVLHYKKLASEARTRDQEGEVTDLMRHSDVCALSVYPHMSYDVPRPVPANFLDFATRFKKPVAVAESGDDLAGHGVEGVQADAPRLAGRPAAVHRAAAADGGAGPLPVRGELRHDRLREAVRPPPAAGGRPGAHLGVHRDAGERRHAEAGAGRVGRPPPRPPRPLTAILAPARRVGTLDGPPETRPCPLPAAPCSPS